MSLVDAVKSEWAFMKEEVSVDSGIKMFRDEKWFGKLTAWENSVSDERMREELEEEMERMEEYTDTLLNPEYSNVIGNINYIPTHYPAGYSAYRDK